MKFVRMEYYKHTDGFYYVLRYTYGCEPSTTPWGWKSKDGAIRYILAHGLEPIEL